MSQTPQTFAVVKRGVEHPWNILEDTIFICGRRHLNDVSSGRLAHAQIHQGWHDGGVENVSGVDEGPGHGVG